MTKHVALGADESGASSGHLLMTLTFPLSIIAHLRYLRFIASDLRDCGPAATT